MSGPSGTPAPTGCVYLGAPVFGKLPIWTQQSRCTITGQRTAARYAGAAAGMGVQAIRCGTFLYRGWNRTREIQKPLVFGGVLFHISFAVERNMAAGGIEKKVVGPLRPKVTRARERGILFAGDMKGTSNGPSGTPAPTGCVYRAAPVFGKPPIWTQQSRCTITDRRVSARCVGAAAIRGVHAIRYTAISIYFGFRGVHGGVL